MAFASAETMMRLLPTALSACCWTICAILLFMWGRSYREADRLHGRLWDRESFLIGSKQGTVSFLWFRSHGHEKWWQWETPTYAVDDEMSFPVGDIDQYQNRLGFGYLKDPMYLVMPMEQNGFMMMGAATATLRGAGPIIPYWFPASIFATLGTWLALRQSSRFGLRAMMLGTTMLVLLMGIAAWALR